MKPTSAIVPLVLSLLTAACAREATYAPAATVPITKAIVEAPPPRPSTPVSPSVSVSADVAAACKLDLDDVETAPKFEFDQSALGARDNAILARIAECVTTGPLAGRALSLVGRADPRGGAEYNMALGARRSSSVRAYLSGLGVPDGQLSGTSRGEIDASGTTEPGWMRDRRVDIVLR